MNYKILYAAALILTFLVTVLISKKLIPVLKSHKMGQPILDIGPRWHKSKEGTPTMGGLAFIAAAVLVGRRKKYPSFRAYSGTWRCGRTDRLHR